MYQTIAWSAIYSLKMCSFNTYTKTYFASNWLQRPHQHLPCLFWPCKLFAKRAISNQFGKFCPTQIWQMVRPRAECLASAYLGWGSRQASSKHNMYIPQITTPLAWITNMLGVLLLSSFLLLFRSMPMRVHCYQPQDTQAVNSCQTLIIALCVYPY